MLTQNERGSANLPTVFSHGNQELRVIHFDSQAWFLGKDITAFLGTRDTSSSFRRLDEDEKLLGILSGEDHPHPRQHLWVNESGLYHLIFTSVKPEAKAFRRWVTGEVLPALRKTGSYSVRPEPKPERPGQQLSLWPTEGPERSRLQDLMVDVALQVRPSSKMAQLIRLVKSMLQQQQSLQP